MYGKSALANPFSSLLSDQLESLRGLSAIVVLFSHCFQAFIAPFDDTFYSLVRLLGQGAVMMFFVLSGYLIGHSIQNNISQDPRFNIAHYTQQRFKRILPPFVFALALTAILYFLAPYVFASGTQDFVYNFGIMIRSDYALNWSEFIGSILFLNGFFTSTVSANAALWSLSYEVWFYVLAGILCVGRIRKNQFVLAVFILLLSFLSWMNIQFLIYFFLWLFAFALSFENLRQLFSPSLKSTRYFFLIFALCIATFDFYQFHYIYLANEYTTENFTLFNVCIGIIFACWIAQLHLGTAQFQPIWAQSADFSYTLYVTHFPLLLFIMGCFPQSLSHFSFAVVALILSMLVLIIVAYLLAQLIEPKRHFSIKSKKL